MFSISFRNQRVTKRKKNQHRDYQNIFASEIITSRARASSVVFTEL